jgi:hypothetical protein
VPALAIKAMIGKVQATQPPTMASEPVSIFFSYSRKDEALMRELESHLEPLRLSRLIESWHDGCITPGEEWEPQIKENLEKADIILLLISVDFIKSDYCYRVELTRAIDRHLSGEACIIPIILRHCLWQQVSIGETKLGQLQALPQDARPVTEWAIRDQAFTNIAEGIECRVQSFNNFIFESNPSKSEVVSIAQSKTEYSRKDHSHSENEKEIGKSREGESFNGIDLDEIYIDLPVIIPFLVIMILLMFYRINYIENLNLILESCLWLVLGYFTWWFIANFIPRSLLFLIGKIIVISLYVWVFVIFVQFILALP